MRWLLATLAVLCFCCEAAGQTTRPSPPGWDRTVQSLSAASGDEDAIGNLLASGCIVHKFGDDHNSTVKSLCDFLSIQAPVGEHAYIFPPQNMAADIAADVGASPLISDQIKHDLALDDPIARNAAAEVAVKWAQQVLHADANTPIGLIILWDAHADEDDQRRLAFVLAKGEAQPDGQYKITAIVWGNPLN
jgi:hypothetical protein